MRNNKSRNYGAVSVVLDKAAERRNPLWIASDDNEVQDGGDKPECGDYCCASPYEQFSGNSLVVEACVFNLSQMGELANRIDDDFAQKHKEIPLRSLYGLRNRIVHDYEGVNLVLIWEIIRDDLPLLREALLTMDQGNTAT